MALVGRDILGLTPNQSITPSMTVGFAASVTGGTVESKLAKRQRWAPKLLLRRQGLEWCLLLRAHK